MRNRALRKGFSLAGVTSLALVLSVPGVAFATEPTPTTDCETSAKCEEPTPAPQTKFPKPDVDATCSIEGIKVALDNTKGDKPVTFFITGSVGNEGVDKEIQVGAGSSDSLELAMSNGTSYDIHVVAKIDKHKVGYTNLKGTRSCSAVDTHVDCEKRKIVVDVTAGEEATDFTVKLGERTKKVHVAAGKTEQVRFKIPDGLDGYTSVAITTPEGVVNREVTVDCEKQEPCPEGKISYNCETHALDYELTNPYEKPFKVWARLTVDGNVNTSTGIVPTEGLKGSYKLAECGTWKVEFGNKKLGYYQSFEGTCECPDEPSSSPSPTDTPSDEPSSSPSPSPSALIPSEEPSSSPSQVAASPVGNDTTPSGGLANTGASGTTVAAVTGGVLLIGGAGAMVMVRRRKNAAA